MTACEDRGICRSALQSRGRPETKGQRVSLWPYLRCFFSFSLAGAGVGRGNEFGWVDVCTYMFQQICTCAPLFLPYLVLCVVVLGRGRGGARSGEMVSVLTCFVLLLVPCAVAAGILWLAVLVLLLAEHVVEELELRGGWEDQQEEYGQQVLCDEVHDVLFSFFLSYSFYVDVQGL